MKCKLWYFNLPHQKRKNRLYLDNEKDGRLFFGGTLVSAFD